MPVWAEDPDYNNARVYYITGVKGLGRIYPDFNRTMIEYLKVFDSIIAKDPIVDLGYRFTYEVAGIDHILVTDKPSIIPHQFLPHRYIFWAKRWVMLE